MYIHIHIYIHIYRHDVYIQYSNIHFLIHTHTVTDQLSEARRAECDALDELSVLRMAYLTETAALREERDADLERFEFERTESAGAAESLTNEVSVCCIYMCVCMCVCMYVYIHT